MGYKVVTIKQNDQDVLVGFVDESAVQVEGADLWQNIFESEAVPAPCSAVKACVCDNSYRSFNIYKLEHGQIVCRTMEELENSEYLDWNFNFKTQAEIDNENQQEEPDEEENLEE
jgi:hypothetical protein